MSQWKKGVSGSPATQFQKGVSGNPHGPSRLLIPVRDLYIITELAAKGCREKDIARGVGVALHTWQKCLNEQVEVREAFDKGRQVMHDSLIGRLYEKAMAGDTACLIFGIKALLGYTEMGNQQEQRPTVTINLPGPLPTLEAWRKAITVQGEKVDAGD